MTPRIEDTTLISGDNCPECERGILFIRSSRRRRATWIDQPPEVWLRYLVCGSCGHQLRRLDSAGRVRPRPGRRKETPPADPIDQAGQAEDTPPDGDPVS